MSGLKALIVEDDTVGRKVTTLFLEPYAKCVSCANGDEAFKEFENSLRTSEPFTLVLLDANVPGTPGLEVLQKIRDLEAGVPNIAPCKVVMLTGRDDPEFMNKAIKFGADRYILKPIVETALISELHSMGVIDTYIE